MSIDETNDPDDPIEWYRGQYLSHQKKNTREAYNSSLKVFEQYLRENNLDVTEVDEQDAIDFLKQVRKNYAANSQENIASTVSNFYDYCLKKGVSDINGNPIGIVLEDFDLLDDVTEPPRHILTVDEMGEYLKTMENPFLFATSVLMAKTGRRLGAVVNLDLCDVHMDHPACDWEVAPPLRHYPNHLYFSPKPQADRVFRGGVRKDSTKTQTETTVPVDDELRDSLIWWLTVRIGEKSKYSPLFTSPVGSKKGDKLLGERTTQGQLNSRLTRKAQDEGYWYEPHDPDNVTPHYFRHFFNNRAKNRMPAEIVDYIRGDKGATVSEQHYDEWDEEKEKIYRENIYKFF